MACVQSEIVRERTSVGGGGKARTSEGGRERVRWEERERGQVRGGSGLPIGDKTAVLVISQLQILPDTCGSLPRCYYINFILPPNIRALSTSDTERREREREGGGRKIKSAVNETTHYKFTSNQAVHLPHTVAVSLFTYLT